MGEEIKKIIVVDSESADSNRTFDEIVALFNPDGSAYASSGGTFSHIRNVELFSGADRDLTPADAEDGLLLVLANGSPMNLNLSAELDWVAGMEIELLNIGVGEVSIVNDVVGLLYDEETFEAPTLDRIGARAVLTFIDSGGYWTMTGDLKEPAPAVIDTDPYGLLTTPEMDGYNVWADEFDDAAIGSDWVQVAVTGGTVQTFAEGNHKLSAVFQGGATEMGGIWLPLASDTLGGSAWDPTETILETKIDFAAHTKYGSEVYFLVSDGITREAKVAGYYLWQNNSASENRLTVGQMKAPKNGSTLISNHIQIPHRIRLVAIDAVTLQVEVSFDGVTWVSYQENDTGHRRITIDFTPTHVGFSGTSAYDYMSPMAIEYLRRYEPVAV